MNRKPLKKQLISLSLVFALAAAMLVPAAVAEEIPADPFEEITAEFRQAVSVEPYTVEVHPTRVTGWAALRWAPSSSAPLMATYPARQELTVRRETPHWLLAENTQTGDVGYIARANAAEPGEAQVINNLNPTIEDNGKTNLGVIDINGAFSLQCALPDGYSIRPVKSARDQMVAIVSAEEPLKPVLQLSVAFDETYASVDRMNDLSDGEFAALEETFTADDPTVEITYSDTGLGTRLMISRTTDGDFDYLDFLSIYKGYFVECVMVASRQDEDKHLTEAEVQMCIDFLTEMDFVPAGEENTGAASIAGQSYITNLTGYDPETDTVQAEVMHIVTVPRETAESLQAGDTLTAGAFSEKIETIENDGNGTILINDGISLIRYGDEYQIHCYGLIWMETYMKLTLPVPDGLTVLDDIDPATGEEREEPAQYTADEFRKMLAAETYPDFATDNTWVTYGDDGGMVRVERKYSPVQ